MNFIIDSTHYVPGRSLVAELINRAQPVIAVRPGEVAEILNAPRAVRHGRIGLKVVGRIRVLHVIKMGDGKNTVP